ncbi:MAG TPA: hypothetical protein VNN73_22460 [Blastocatellia bacterium]|nr:hypothetical protein [Blastocatellia bacterium]
MKRNVLLASILILVFTISMLTAPAYGQSKKSNGDSDVAMELVGQVLNAGSSSAQYGYVTYINGLDNIFIAGPQNETTALFKFYNESTTVRVINNGPLRIVNRVGTTTIYLDSTPDGDFNNPDSFRNGVPVMISTFRHQVILDTATNQFTTTFVNTITFVETFQFENQNIRLGKVGQKFRTVVFGRQNATGAGPAQFVIAGYVAGGDLTR